MYNSVQQFVWGFAAINGWFYIWSLDEKRHLVLSTVYVPFVGIEISPFTFEGKVIGVIETVCAHVKSHFSLLFFFRDLGNDQNNFTSLFTTFIQYHDTAID